METFSTSPKRCKTLPADISREDIEHSAGYLPGSWNGDKETRKQRCKIDADEATVKLLVKDRYT